MADYTISGSGSDHGNENTLIIKEGTQYIESGEFKDRTDLTSVVIPDSVTAIGASAFEGCSGLTRARPPLANLAEPRREAAVRVEPPKHSPPGDGIAGHRTGP